MRLSFAPFPACVALALALALGACSGSPDRSGAQGAATSTASPSTPATSTGAAPMPTPSVDLDAWHRLAQHATRSVRRDARAERQRERERRERRQARLIAAQNPLNGREWGVYHGTADQSWLPYTRATGENRALLATIVEEPKAQWFGGWISDAAIYGKVRAYIENAQAGDPDKLVQFAVFRMRPWEHEACRRLPTAAEQASYKRWIDAFAAAVGDTPAAIILQPDGPFALCVPRDSPLPSSLIAYSARVFADLPHAATYIDAGAADWPAIGQGGVPPVLDFLIPNGIEYVRGIALNSTHYSPTSEEVRRGADIIEALAERGITGKKMVVNTSSNGQGFVFGDAPGRDPDNATVCASRADTHCVTLGIPPTTDVDDPGWGLSEEVADLARRYADGYLWFGRPWLYRQADPFDLARALQLARTTPY